MRIRNLLIAGAVLCWGPLVGAQPAQEQPAATPDPIALAKVAAVQRHVDAYRSGSLDRFVATFAPDAEVYANGMVAVGHDQIRALYQLNFAPGAPAMRIEDSGIIGDHVFLSVAYVFPNGEEVCCSYSEYEITDGKISYLEASG